MRRKQGMERLSMPLQFLMLCQVALLTKAVTLMEDDGGWGEWSPCTRTCGPAISTQERVCLNETCDGPQRQFRSCLNEPCTEPVDLRAELCATLNDTNLTYSPLNEERHCLLTCKAMGEDGEMIVRGPLEALPGTRCTTVSEDEGQCVDAMCAPVGCDGILGSKRKIDRCGRCIAQGFYSNDDCTRTFVNKTREPTKGHMEMVKLPSGASAISITNLVPPQKASLMVRSRSGDFLFTVGPPGSKFQAEGAEFTYNVVLLEGNYKEIITSAGKLNESVTIEIYIPSREVAPSIIYEYYSVGPSGRIGDLRSPLVSSTSTIHWAYGPLLPCTDTCATGIQTAYALCIDNFQEQLRILPDTYCDSVKPTPILRFCGSEDCPPRWVTGEWWPCSGSTCGTGSQERLVQCLLLEASGRDRMVGDEMCNITVKPSTVRECAVRENSGCDAQWQVDEWRECCSEEPIERRVECVDTDGHVQPPFFCSQLPRNDSVQKCKRGRCSNGGCSWVPKRWFMCNNTCGQGLQRRNVRCRNAEDKAAQDYCCQDQPLPGQQRECYDDRSTRCQPQWHTGSWNKCSGGCGDGNGTRNRSVVCQAESKQGTYVEFPDHFCANESRPGGTEQCTCEVLQCSDCEWVASEWGKCYCPVGIRLRTVVCSSGNDSCCTCRPESKLPDGESCDCPIEGISPLPLPSPTTSVCVDNPGVNCTQLKEDGYCFEDNTDFFEQLCCQTCSSQR